jgi:hypothetical protein
VIGFDRDEYLIGAMPYATEETLRINGLLGGNDYNIYQHIESIVGDFHIALQGFVWPRITLEVFELLSCPLGSVVYLDHPRWLSPIGYFRDVSITLDFEWQLFTTIGGGWGRCVDSIIIC